MYIVSYRIVMDTNGANSFIASLKLIATATRYPNEGARGEGVMTSCQHVTVDDRETELKNNALKNVDRHD